MVVESVDIIKRQQESAHSCLAWKSTVLTTWYLKCTFPFAKCSQVYKLKTFSYTVAIPRLDAPQHKQHIRNQPVWSCLRGLLECMELGSSFDVVDEGVKLGQGINAAWNKRRCEIFRIHTGDPGQGCFKSGEGKPFDWWAAIASVMWQWGWSRSRVCVLVSPLMGGKNIYISKGCLDILFSLPLQYRYFNLEYELIMMSIWYQYATDDTYSSCSVKC